MGGVYGVKVGNLFSAESMFYYKSDASKCALYFGIEWLRGMGLTWIDCQVINPNTERLGAVEIPRKKYMGMLKEALGSLVVSDG